MKIRKTKTINWNFGEKHKEYIRRCRDNTINVAEGAVRAGKTIDNIFAFAMELEWTEDKIHLASGSTVANAKTNIGEANGFGLEHIFRGRSRWGKFKDNECLYINTITGQKVVIFVGGMKADSYKSFRGYSIGMWIATEINLHHDNTIKEAFNRQLMAKNRKIFWDLNPDNPKHSIYTQYIDKYQKLQEKGQLVGGYNYEHFTIYDNINLTEQRIHEIVSQYDKNSVWYQRDILGKRVTAEGLIYRQFANDPGRYEISIEKAKETLYREIVVGIDFGGNKSKHAFVATGILPKYKGIVVLASERHDTDITPAELDNLFIDFLRKVISMYGKVDYVYPDSAEQVLIRGFKAAVKKENLNVIIRDAKKIEIRDRIRLVSALISQGRFFYTKDAYTVRDALCEAVWDESKNEDVRLDDGTTDIDTLDALEYTIERDARRFMRVG